MRQTNASLLNVANQYNMSAGHVSMVHDYYMPWDAELAERTASEYDKLDVYNDDAKLYYDALIREVQAQYDMLISAGYVMIVTDDDPYASSADMMRDAESRVLRVLATNDKSAHPYMTNAQNDMFRFVHDLFGHAMHGFEFGPRGEFNAMLSHAQMFGPYARMALYTETHGQNSVYQQTGSFAQQKVNVLPYTITSELEFQVDALR